MNDDTPLNESTEAVPADVAQQTPEAAAAPLSAGAQLRSWREARGWTIEQVANQLNLASRQIDALERDNYAALPGMVIVRGFIRTYAKLLQVDAAPILAAIQDQGETAEKRLPPVRTVTPTSFSETQLKSDSDRSFPRKTLVVVLLVLGVLAFVVYQGQRMGWKMEHKGQAKTNDVAATMAVQQTPTPTESVTQSSAATAAAVSEHEATGATVPPVATESKAAEEKSAPLATGKNVLAIQVRQDSWIEIRRADDGILFSQLLKAGASESIDLPGPVSVVVGNAAGVDMTLRGVPVDLKGNASNVARLNLK